MTKASTFDAVTNVVATSYLSIVQDISAGIASRQIIAVNCEGDDMKETCNSCQKRLKSTLKKVDGVDPQAGERSACEFICTCKLSDAKQDQQISINLKNFLETGVQAQFVDAVSNNLRASSTTSGSPLGMMGNDITNTTESINKIYQSMTSDTFQEVMQNFSNYQLITVTGPGNIQNVSMEMALDYVGSALLQNAASLDALQSLHVAVLQDATQIAEAGITEVLNLIIQVILLVVICFVLFYVLELGFQVLILGVVSSKKS